MHAVEGVGEGVGAPVGVVGEGERGVRRAARVSKNGNQRADQADAFLCVSSVKATARATGHAGLGQGDRHTVPPL